MRSPSSGPRVSQLPPMGERPDGLVCPGSVLGISKPQESTRNDPLGAVDWSNVQAPPPHAKKRPLGLEPDPGGTPPKVCAHSEWFSGTMTPLSAVKVFGAFA